MRLAEAEIGAGASGGERGGLPPVGSSLIYQGLGDRMRTTVQDVLDGFIAERACPCPPFCSPWNPLNS